MAGHELKVYQRTFPYSSNVQKQRGLQQTSIAKHLRIALSPLRSEFFLNYRLPNTGNRKIERLFIRVYFLKLG